MSDSNKKLSLREAASRFLVTLPSKEAKASQQEVYRFVRWFGEERSPASLTAAEVGNYAEQMAVSDTDYHQRLGLVQAFLVYAKKEDWSDDNLAIHLKVKKVKPRVSLSARKNTPGISLTQEGYATAQRELSVLKVKRAEVIDEMRKAAADKDFRENAPLQAAREQLGHLEGRIKELEAMLKLAVVMSEKQEIGFKSAVGDSLVLRDLTTGDELCYTIVSPREVDPTNGKISSISPIGKALIGRGVGEEVEITIPAGTLRYQVQGIKH